MINQVTHAANDFMAQAPASVGKFQLAAGIELRSAGAHVDLGASRRRWHDCAWNCTDELNGGRIETQLRPELGYRVMGR